MHNYLAQLEAAIASGDWSSVPLADGVRLRSSSPAGLVRRSGPEDVRAHLAAAGPGAVAHWQASAWPAGAALSFEWHGRTRDRRRWYVRVDPAGAITDVWSYAARPKDDAPIPDLPAAVAAALPGPVTIVPLEHGGNSGAGLLRARTADGTDVVVKRLVPGADWLGRITGDDGRTGRLWASGALGVLEPLLDTGIVAAVRDDDGAWWVVMRDVSATLLGDERRMSRAQARAVLAAAAGMHRTFRGRPPEGTATLEARLGMSSPAISEQERDATDLLPKQFELAWEAFAAAADADVAEPVLALARDAAPLARALRARAPLTLVHGDLRDDNLGFDGERVVLLDWDLATAGTPSVEFAWFLVHDAWRTDATHDELEADFRAAEGDLDPEEVELGLLSGLVQYGWVLGHSALVHPDPAETAWAREELGWWVPRVRTALERLGGPPA